MPSLPDPSLDPHGPPALQARAIDELRYIRRTMEEAASFTTVSGTAQVAIGLTALLAAWIASRQTSDLAWNAVWMTEAVIAVSLSAWGMVRKSRAMGLPAFAGPARRFAVTFALPLLAGALLTVALERAGRHEAVPGTWLLLFGTAVACGGAFSVRIVPLLGFAFMALGAVSLFSPPTWGNAYMAAGFGGLLIAFGLVVARKYGG